ncbi:hypothetical protein [Amycolatopsis pithecellobii]|uniref:Oxidoreductase n=1 Tax=Amycolatopsis pithecellobii TaxID=664692 RepID=A0A6N7YIR6_9PSEU|nr:hypothetical protein [Amycolatopsis pithecellobii]MTD52797.1 hypothetical protein [Amycolatopsis pithecellobii]
MSGDLTEAELALVQAARVGEWADLSEAEDQQVRGVVFRDLVLGRLGEVDPRGIWLKRAHLVGGLDLCDIETRFPLRLLSCRTDEPVQLIRANLSTVDLTGLVAPYVAAQEATFEHSFTLRDARLTSVGPPALHVGGSEIGGLLNLARARLANTDGVALQGSNVRTGGGVFLNHRFRAEGTGDLGAVRLSGASIGGQLNFTGARITNPDGPALIADYLRTESSVMLGQGFVAEGRQDTGTVRLVGARIGGRLTAEDGLARAADHEHLALNLSQTSVVGDLLLPASFTEGRLDVNGLTYGGQPRLATLDEWLELLTTRTNYYASQPYFQLATAHAAAGHERDVRRIHIVRQKDLLRRGQLGFWGRLWHRITGLTVGYGYRPALALVWLIGTVLTSVLVTVVAARPTGSCSVVERVGPALSTVTPLVKADTPARCLVNTTTVTGQAVLVANWALQALAWAFLTLFVAGFTGLVRRSQ